MIAKSLRAKFTLLLFIVGIIPFITVSVFLYLSIKDALFKNVFKELKWNVEDISLGIESQFNQLARDLIVSSQNTAFSMYFREPGNKTYWTKRQRDTLSHLYTIYKEVLDEACFIDIEGREISRITLGKIATEDELSSEEARSFFFKQAFLMKEGEIYQGSPEISEDTQRWVVPHATPIYVDGVAQAILHFEVPISYFQRLLKQSINPDRGFGFIVSDAGDIIAHTQKDISETEPFQKALNPAMPDDLKSIYERMISGESGMEHYTEGAIDYYIYFSPIAKTRVKGRSNVSWSLGYVIPTERTYVELSIIKYNVITLGITLVLVLIIAYVAGNYITKPVRELAKATHKVAGGEIAKITVKSEDEIGVLTRSFNDMAEAVKKRDEALRELAITDGLTGLYNHRFMKQELDRGIKTALRFARPISVLMIDVDYFKHYNDTNGHGKGDMALKKIADIIGKCSREVDIAARYGGEEFSVILPETALAGALILADRIRQKVADEVILNEEKQPNGNVTVSVGVAEIKDDAKDVTALLQAADKALYKAKELGRNRVCSIENMNETPAPAKDGDPKKDEPSKKDDALIKADTPKKDDAMAKAQPTGKNEPPKKA
ncbi:MAG: diguanylate cyclase [Deltaproteobacteria bacterium]